MKKYALWSVAILLPLGLFISTKVHSQGQGLPAFNPGAEWKASDELFSVNDESWTLNADSRVFAASSIHMNTTIGDMLTPDKLDSVIAEYTQGRLAAMRLVGIDDWKVTSRDLKVRFGTKVLTLKGTYHDSGRVPVQFEEINLFKGNKFVTFQVIYPQDSDYSRSGKATATLEKFKAAYRVGGDK